jgi:hypothetical protein
MRWLVCTKTVGDDAVYYGPFESEEQADDWREGARQAWPLATIWVFPLNSPWD